MSSRQYSLDSEDIQKLNARLLYISASKYEDDWFSIPHVHYFTELIYVVRGNGIFIQEDQSFPITANDLVIIPPYAQHTEASKASSPLEYIVLGIEGITFHTEGSPSQNILYNYGKHSETLILLKMLLKEAESKGRWYDLVCHDILEILLVQIIRSQSLIPAPLSSARMPKECSQIKQYLDSHYSEAITLDWLANWIHMNKYYMVHAFTEYTGMSPIHYLNKRRLEVSRELLKTTDYSISRIASLAGFSSQSYFAQVFKKDCGLSPAAYRRENANVKKP